MQVTADRMCNSFLNFQNCECGCIDRMILFTDGASTSKLFIAHRCVLSSFSCCVSSDSEIVVSNVLFNFFHVSTLNDTSTKYHLVPLSGFNVDLDLISWRLRIWHIYVCPWYQGIRSEKVGIIDAEYLIHKGIPSLGGPGRNKVSSSKIKIHRSRI